MSTMLQDLRYAVRVLRKQPAFSLTAALVLSLGIGGSSAIFSIVNGMFLRPLLIRQPQRIVGVYSKDTVKPGTYRAFSYPNYADLRADNRVFSSLTAHNLALVGLTEGDSTRRVFADAISANYFATFGVPLYRGRPFAEAEEQPGSGIPAAILSYNYWTKRGADPDILGKTVQVNGRAYTIIGIAPAGFTGTAALISPELYLPLGMYEHYANDFEGHVKPLAARDNPVLMLVGRLQDGVSPQQADAALALVAERLAKAYPAENKDQTLLTHRLSRMSISTAPESDSELTAPFVLLMAMAGVVLLIASLNVASMMLARGAARRREIGIRMALGARRRNIAQQLFTEGLVLSLAGGAAGIVVAYAGTTLLVRSLARMVPLDLVFSAAPDWRVAAATAGFSVLSALVFGLGPARSLSRGSVIADIKEESGQREPARRFSRRNLLVAGQIALSLMLVSAAGLFLRSAWNAAAVQPGFRIDNEVVVELDPSLAGYDETRGRQLYRTLLERLGNLPGVQSASLAATVPFGMFSLGRTVERADAPAAANQKGLSFRSNIVSENYFTTLGIPVLRGRSFQESQTAGGPAVVILDQNAAEKLWPHGNPIGQRVRFSASDAAKQATVEAEVVGIVGNVQDDVIGSSDQPHVYLPFAQQYQANMNIHLQVAHADSTMLEAVRREVLAVDGRLALLSLRSLRTHVDSSFGLWVLGIAARMFSIFAATALLLAMVGLYGLRAYTVARRTREIGIRMALGARPSEARRMILREGLALTAAGLGVGLLLSVSAGKAVASLLYRVPGFDPLVLGTAAAVLAVVSLVACYLPAARASRVDPMIALRQE